MKFARYITIAALCAALSACSETLVPEQEGYVRVCLGGCYPQIDEAATKAAVHNAELAALTPQPLPDGTTLWILVEQDADRDGDWKEETNLSRHPYVVAGEGSSLYPCEVDEDGNEIPGTRGSLPMLLGDGRFRFHAVSPARQLNSDHSMRVRNGQYLLATDSRYLQTESVVVDITPSSHSTGVQTVKLNPLVNQTAQIRINLLMGENVSSVEIMPEGVEVSGIQEDHGGLDFKWTRDDNSLPIIVGNKNMGVKITDWETLVIGGEKVVSGNVAILPTDARANAIMIMFNITVNGVPTQYMTSLTRQQFEAARSYVYNYRVNVKHGINVAVWDNLTITEEIDFTK